MRLSTRVLKRDFSGDLVTAANLEPLRYDWHALGGPATAEIRASGPPWAIWALCDWVRAPIEILDERGTAVWWGFVAEVTLGTGAIELGLSIDSMANRVAVQYQDQGSGSSSTGVTGWLEDADSVIEYGMIERMASVSSGSAAAASGLRLQMLNTLRYPVPVIRHTGRAGEMTATIRCRGWWDSLGWQYYGNESLASATNTEQITTVLSQKAQYITAVDLLATGDISLSEYQDGTKTSKEIVENLLAAGLANGTGLLATVTRDRVVRIYEESTDDRLFLQADGQILDIWGNPLLQHTCPVAQRCLLRDVIPATVDVDRMANPTRFFVQRSEFTVEDWRLLLEPRGTESPWEALGSSGGVASGNDGQTWVGLYEGPHAGLFAVENKDDGTWSVLLRAVDTANVPFLSVGERNYASNSKWLRIGYEDALHIQLKDSTGSGTDPEEHPDIEVPAGACAIVDAGDYFAATDVEGALQELGAGGGAGAVDASDVTYTPAEPMHWEGDADPGDVDNALDQLAERVDELEVAPAGGAYRQFAYVVTGGDFSFVIDGGGRPVMALQELE